MFCASCKRRGLKSALSQTCLTPAPVVPYVLPKAHGARRQRPARALTAKPGPRPIAGTSPGTPFLGLRARDPAIESAVLCRGSDSGNLPITVSHPAKTDMLGNKPEMFGIEDRGN